MPDAQRPEGRGGENIAGARLADSGNAQSEAVNRLSRMLMVDCERGEAAQQVLRSEYKYLLTLSEAHSLERVLSALVEADAHNGEDGYSVRSLYFDTPDDRDYTDKLDGVDSRRKLRLRIYDPNDGCAFLEMKQKQGAKQRKRSLRITREDAQRLIAAEYGVLYKYDAAFAEECFVLMSMGVYRPGVIVQFQRSAYISCGNDTRITFDHTLKATQASIDLFSNELCLYPVLDPYAVILEVKYNGFLLNHIKQLVSAADRTAVAQSKYCLARAATI